MNWNSIKVYVVSPYLIKIKKGYSSKNRDVDINWMYRDFPLLSLNIILLDEYFKIINNMVKHIKMTKMYKLITIVEDYTNSFLS